jgi:hypothetical protein
MVRVRLKVRVRVKVKLWLGLGSAKVECIMYSESDLVPSPSLFFWKMDQSSDTLYVCTCTCIKTCYIIDAY